MWGVDGNSFKKRVSYNIKTWKIIKLRKGLYVLSSFIDDLDFQDIFSLANIIYTPSYISYETVTQKEWLTFQDYNRIFVASNYTKEINISKLELDIEFIKLPEWLLLEPIGLVNKWNYTIATPERAVCDILYRSGNYYFDNLESINWKLLEEIWEVYSNYKKKVYKLVLLLKKQHEQMAEYS